MGCAHSLSPKMFWYLNLVHFGEFWGSKLKLFLHYYEKPQTVGTCTKSANDCFLEITMNRTKTVCKITKTYCNCQHQNEICKIHLISTICMTVRCHPTLINYSEWRRPILESMHIIQDLLAAFYNTTILRQVNRNVFVTQLQNSVW